MGDEGLRYDGARDVVSLRLARPAHLHETSRHRVFNGLRQHRGGRGGDRHRLSDGEADDRDARRRFRSRDLSGIRLRRPGQADTGAPAYAGLSIRQALLPLRRRGAPILSVDWIADSASESSSGFSFHPGPASTCAFSSGGYTTNRPWTAPGSYALCFDPFGRPQQTVGSTFSSLVKVDRTDSSKWYSDTSESATTHCVNGCLGTDETCGSGGVNATTTDVKDAFGRLTSVKEPDLAVTSYTYDVNDKLTRVTQSGLPDRTFTYDPAGFLLSETTPEKGSVNYGYGGLGNILSETFPGSSLTVNRAYDFAGRVTAVTSNEGGRGPISRTSTTTRPRETRSAG